MKGACEVLQPFKKKQRSDTRSLQPWVLVSFVPHLLHSCVWIFLPVRSTQIAGPKIA